jgi:AraC-like DNA-binding protein
MAHMTPMTTFDQRPPPPATEAPATVQALYHLFAEHGIHKKGRLTRASIIDHLNKAYQLRLAARAVQTLSHQWFGLDIDHYVNWWRIYEACQLLSQGYNIKTVQKFLAISDRANFTRLFRTVAAMTPSHYLSSLCNQTSEQPDKLDKRKSETSTLNYSERVI